MCPGRPRPRLGEWIDWVNGQSGQSGHGGSGHKVRAPLDSRELVGLGWSGRACWGRWDSIRSQSVHGCSVTQCGPCGIPGVPSPCVVPFPRWEVGWGATHPGSHSEFSAGPGHRPTRPIPDVRCVPSPGSDPSWSTWSTWSLSPDGTHHASLEVARRHHLGPQASQLHLLDNSG